MFPRNLSFLHFSVGSRFCSNTHNRTMDPSWLPEGPKWTSVLWHWNIGYHNFPRKRHQWFGIRGRRAQPKHVPAHTVNFSISTNKILWRDCKSRIASSVPFLELVVDQSSSLKQRTTRSHLEAQAELSSTPTKASSWVSIKNKCSLVHWTWKFSAWQAQKKLRWSHEFTIFPTKIYFHPKTAVPVSFSQWRWRN